jgi:hypothetical protein
MITTKHPDYDVLAPVLMELKLRARKLILNSNTDVEQIVLTPIKQEYCFKFRLLIMLIN